MTNQNFLTKEQIEICNKAFQKMPDEFSSREFGKLIRLYGLDDRFVDSNKMLYYLKGYSRLIKGRRTWIKNDAKNFIDDIIDKNKPVINEQDAINEAIKLLVSTGKYKIFEKIEEFKPIN